MALALIDERPDLVVSASDASAAAVEVARRNGLDRRRSVRGLPPGDYDLVVANLPYVREDEWAGLAPEIGCGSRARRSCSGADGLDAIRSLVAAAPPGRGWRSSTRPTQADAVRALLRSDARRRCRDLAGRAA